MIHFHLDPATAILTVRPQAKLDTEDFTELAAAVDPQSDQHGDLAGLILEAAHFPGWDSVGSMLTHLKFVRDHQKHVKKVAVVTDSHLGDLAEHIGGHFVSAEIRHFPAGQADQARAWITG